jgi:hypothetical protein
MALCCGRGFNLLVVLLSVGCSFGWRWVDETLDLETCKGIVQVGVCIAVLKLVPPAISAV